MFEYLGITLAELEQFLLILVRIGAMLTAMPLLSSPSIDIRFRMALSMFLAFLTANVIPVPEILPISFMHLIFYTGKEVLVGLIIGVSSRIIFEGLHLAGFMMGRMMSLTMMTLVDPTSEDQVQVLGQMKYFVAVMLLFATNGHLFFLQALFDSFYIIPLTGVSLPMPLMNQMVRITSEIFVIGIKIGAPIFAVLLIERVILGLLAKLNPDMHVLIVAMPLGILVGLYMLTFYWPYFASVFLHLFDGFREDLMGVVKAMGG